MMMKTLEELRVIDLRQELERKGLDKTGVKSVLVERLKKALEEEGQDVNTYKFENLSSSPRKSNEEAETPVKKPVIKRDNKHVISDLVNEDDEEEVEEEEEEAGSEECDAESNMEARDEEKDEEGDGGDEQEDEMDDGNCIMNEDEEREFQNLVEEEEDEHDEDEDIDEEVEVPEKKSPAKLSKKRSSFSQQSKEQEKGNDDRAMEDDRFADDEMIYEDELSDEDDEGIVMKASETPTATLDVDNSCEKSDDAAAKKLDNKDSSKAVEDSESSPIKDAEKDASTVAEKDGAAAEKTLGSVMGRNLWVSNLKNPTKAGDLKAYFAKHGRVITTKIVANTKVSGGKCFGYIVMGSEEEAAKCIEELNNSMFCGDKISVEKAKGEPGVKKIALPVADQKKEEGKKFGRATLKEGQIKAALKESGLATEDKKSEKDDSNKKEQAEQIMNEREKLRLMAREKLKKRESEKRQKEHKEDKELSNDVGTLQKELLEVRKERDEIRKQCEDLETLTFREREALRSEREKLRIEKAELDSQKKAFQQLKKEFDRTKSTKRPYDEKDSFRDNKRPNLEGRRGDLRDSLSFKRRDEDRPGRREDDRDRRYDQSRGRRGGRRGDSYGRRGDSRHAWNRSGEDDSRYMPDMGMDSWSDSMPRNTNMWSGGTRSASVSLLGDPMMGGIGGSQMMSTMSSPMMGHMMSGSTSHYMNPMMQSGNSNYMNTMMSAQQMRASGRPSAESLLGKHKRSNEPDFVNKILYG